MADDNSLEGMSEAQLRELAQIQVDLANDPQTRPYYLRLLKAKRPGTVIPELEVEARVAAALKPMHEKTKELEGKLQQTEMERSVEAKRSQAKRDLGINDEELEGLETFMVEQHKEGNAFSYKTAHEFLKLRKTAAEPTAPNYKWEKPALPDKDELKKVGGFKKHFLSEAHKAVDDLRNGRVKLH